MHVAFNALGINNRSGTGRYCWGLLDGFIKNWQTHPSKESRLSVFIPSDFDSPESWQTCHGVSFFPISTNTFAHRILWEQARLPQWINRLGCDLLHSPAFIAPVFRNCNFRHVVTIHDLAFKHYPETIPLLRRIYYRSIIPKSIRLADALITDSSAVEQQLRSCYPCTKTVVPIHLGVNTHQFSPTKENNDHLVLKHLGIKQPYILFVGTREPRKNLPLLINAYSRASERGFDTDLVLCGRIGWMQKEQKTHSGVVEIGHVADNELPALYRNALALIAPSLDEGFDLPTIEALACGIPIIASDISVHREVLGFNAQYIPTDSASAWEKALLSLHTSPLQELNHPPRTWQDVASETWNIYDETAK